VEYRRRKCQADPEYAQVIRDSRRKWRDAHPSERPQTGEGSQSAEVLLYEAMRSQGVRKATPARRIGCHKSQMATLLDLTHASRMDQIESAFRALGKRLDAEVRDAA
jgi:hypothetical protein